MFRHQGLTRREILRQISTAAAFLAAHELLGQSAATQPAASARPQGDAAEPRILALRLLTAVPLAEMRKFYHGKIGFDVAEESKSEVTFKAGTTRLTFVQALPGQIKGNGGRGNGEPMYHFAFNIPRNKIETARKWQLERTPLVPPRNDVRDSNMPVEVWHFRHWNDSTFSSIRPGTSWSTSPGTIWKNEPAADRFDVKDIRAQRDRYVTTRNDQSKTIAFMRENSLERVSARAEPWAMGDERCLLLCLARAGEQWAEHTETPVNWGVFPTECTIRGPKPGKYDIAGFPFSVRAE
jgi:hypothetical protein